MIGILKWLTILHDPSLWFQCLQNALLVLGCFINVLFSLKFFVVSYHTAWIVKHGTEYRNALLDLIGEWQQTGVDKTKFDDLFDVKSDNKPSDNKPSYKIMVSYDDWPLHSLFCFSFGKAVSPFSRSLAGFIFSLPFLMPSQCFILCLSTNFFLINIGMWVLFANIWTSYVHLFISSFFLGYCDTFMRKANVSHKDLEPADLLRSRLDTTWNNVLVYLAFAAQVVFGYAAIYYCMQKLTGFHAFNGIATFLESLFYSINVKGTQGLSGATVKSPLAMFFIINQISISLTMGLFLIASFFANNRDEEVKERQQAIKIERLHCQNNPHVALQSPPATPAKPKRGTSKCTGCGATRNTTNLGPCPKCRKGLLP